MKKAEIFLGILSIILITIGGTLQYISNQEWKEGTQITTGVAVEKYYSRGDHRIAYEFVLDGDLHKGTGTLHSMDISEGDSLFIKYAIENPKVNELLGIKSDLDNF